jgi:hypothetical protein
LAFAVRRRPPAKTSVRAPPILRVCRRLCDREGIGRFLNQCRSSAIRHSPIGIEPPPRSAGRAERAGAHGFACKGHRANGVPDACRREPVAGRTRSSCAILSVKQERAIVLATKPSIPVVRYAHIAVIGRRLGERIKSTRSGRTVRFHQKSASRRVGVWRGDVRLGISVPAPFVWRCLVAQP